MDRIISFDCYGTIIDWEEGITVAFEKLLKRRGMEVSSEELLSRYAKIEAELENSYRPYREILREVAVKLARSFGVELSKDEKNVLVSSLPSWPPFPDSRDALLKIKEKGKIAIISNIDNALIEKTVKNLGVDFDFIITAEMAGAYKPSLKIFELAHSIFKVPKSRWIHVAQSIYHDIRPAKSYGITAVWIRRRGYGATLPISGTPDLMFNSLQDFSLYLSKRF